MKNTIVRFVAALPVVCISFGIFGCAAVPTSEEDAFALRYSGKIANGSSPEFVDCVTDGFKKVSFTVWAYHITTQEKRKDGYRIEFKNSAGGGLPFTRVDIKDDGSYSMVERIKPMTIGLSGMQKEAEGFFLKCVNR